MQHIQLLAGVWQYAFIYWPKLKETLSPVQKELIINNTEEYTVDNRQLLHEISTHKSKVIISFVWIVGGIFSLDAVGISYMRDMDGLCIKTDNTVYPAFSWGVAITPK